MVKRCLAGRRCICNDQGKRPSTEWELKGWTCRADNEISATFSVLRWFIVLFFVISTFSLSRGEGDEWPSDLASDRRAAFVIAGNPIREEYWCDNIFFLLLLHLSDVEAWYLFYLIFLDHSAWYSSMFRFDWPVKECEELVWFMPKQNGVNRGLMASKTNWLDK